MCDLFQDSREDVRLEKWDPNKAIVLTAEGGIELLILAGGFEEGGEHFKAHSWLRLPPGAPLAARTGPEGCTVWRKTGHLAHPIVMPDPAAG